MIFQDLRSLSAPRSYRSLLTTALHGQYSSSTRRRNIPRLTPAAKDGLVRSHITSDVPQKKDLTDVSSGGVSEKRIDTKLDRECGRPREAMAWAKALGQSNSKMDWDNFKVW